MTYKPVYVHDNHVTMTPPATSANMQPNDSEPTMQTEVRCHATNPNPAARRVSPGARCNRFLGFVPLRLRYIDVFSRAPDGPDGNYWVRCPRKECRAWNVFEVVEPKGEASCEFPVKPDER